VNEIKGFTFYKNYYDIIKYLDDNNKLIMLNAILEYIFEEKEPELEGLNLGIWNNIKMPLNTTKTNITNGKKGGRPKTQTKTETKPKPKPKAKPKGKANNISYFLFLFSNLYISNLNNKDNIYKLFKEYLELRTKNKYTVTETVVKRLINKLNEYGTTDEEKIEIITNAINGAWKDFYPLKKHEEKPNWYGKELEETSASDDEIKELEERLKRI
jgi:hypothetical protein